MVPKRKRRAPVPHKDIELIISDFRDMRAGLIQTKTDLLIGITMEKPGARAELAQVNVALDKVNVALSWLELYVQGISPKEAYEQGMLKHTQEAIKAGEKDARIKTHI